MIPAITEDEWIRSGAVGAVATVLVTTLVVAIVVGAAIVLTLAL